jgi:hypothetical protein
VECSLVRLLGGEAHICEYVGLCFIEECGEFQQLGTYLVRDSSPLGPSGFGIIPGERPRSAIESTRSQNITVSWRRSADAAGVSGVGMVGLKLTSATDEAANFRSPDMALMSPKHPPFVVEPRIGLGRIRPTA